MNIKCDSINYTLRTGLWQQDTKLHFTLGWFVTKASRQRTMLLRWHLYQWRQCQQWPQDSHALCIVDFVGAATRVSRRLVGWDLRVRPRLEKCTMYRLCQRYDMIFWRIRYLMMLVVFSKWDQTVFKNPVVTDVYNIQVTVYRLQFTVYSLPTASHSLTIANHKTMT